MILFFDTETSGMYQWERLHNHTDQPHLMQIAAIMTDDSGKIITQFSSLVKPIMKYRVDPEAEKVHGLTWDMCNDQGIESEQVMELFVDMCKKSNLIVAHNMKFDNSIMKSFFHRLSVIDLLDDKKKFCTMAATTNILKLPGKFEGKYKWPKLDECLRFFFAEDLTNAHDAMSDVMACKRVFFHLANHYDVCLTTGDGRIMLIIMVDDAHDFDGLVIEDHDGNVFTVGEDARIIGKRAMRHNSSYDA